MTLRNSALLLSLFTGTAAMAVADAIPYPTPGVPATPTTITAASTGVVTGYFLGSNAGDTDTVALLDLTTNQMSGFFFNNKATAIGTSQVFGNVTAGDTLVFVLNDLTTNSILYSNLMSNDGIPHAYFTPFSGSTGVPPGTYVGFDDQLLTLIPSADLDYNDNSFAFTNLSVSNPNPSPVPEPSSLALLGTGALGAFGVLRRRFTKR